LAAKVTGVRKKEDDLFPCVRVPIPLFLFASAQELKMVNNIIKKNIARVEKKRQITHKAQSHLSRSQ